MDFNLYKNKTYENLTEKEKLDWKRFAEQNQDKIKKWTAICLLKKCFMCKTKFPNGIVKPMPYDTDVPLIQKIKPDFLFHLKATHGLDIEFLTDWFLQKERK